MKGGGCWTSGSSGSEGRVLVHATIGPDGKVGQYRLSPGVESWQVETAKCVMELMRFEPATKNGSPVSAEAKIPLNLSLIGSEELTMPKLASSELEVEDAYRACYPADELAIAEPRYRVTLSKLGKVTKVELVESAGLDSLDQAGICMLKRLSFQAARRGREPVQSTAIMPILLRPPR